MLHNTRRRFLLLISHFQSLLRHFLSNKLGTYNKERVRGTTFFKYWIISCMSAMHLPPPPLRSVRGQYSHQASPSQPGRAAVLLASQQPRKLQEQFLFVRSAKTRTKSAAVPALEHCSRQVSILRCRAARRAARITQYREYFGGKFKVWSYREICW